MAEGKDPRQKTVEALRKKMMGEVEPLVCSLKDDPNVLAVVVVGSAARGAVTEKSDVDLLAITEKQVGNGFGPVYRYYLPKFTAVERRAEVGFFPLDFIEDKLDERLGDIIGQRFVGQLKEARVLWERDSIAGDIIERCRGISASPSKIGKEVCSMKEKLWTVSSLVENGHMDTALYLSRYTTREALLTFCLHRFSQPFAKSKHELEGFRKMMPGHISGYMRIWGLDGISKALSNELVNNSGLFVQDIFNEVGLREGFALEWEAVASDGVR